MYHVAVSFQVEPGHREDFVAAAVKDGRESGANEPGTRRFELIADEQDPNRFYLNEAYDSLAAFNVHAEGAYFQAFFTEIADYADGPTWLIRGERVEQRTA
jgi:(4S)-4-hydroxy-5-phosphonooxypentane-2,3-dione isomerase